MWTIKREDREESVIGEWGASCLDSERRMRFPWSGVAVEKLLLNIVYSKAETLDILTLGIPSLFGKPNKPMNRVLLFRYPVSHRITLRGEMNAQSRQE